MENVTKFGRLDARDGFAPAGAAAVELDGGVGQVSKRDRVLQVVRQFMPVDLLVNPANQIDLPLFLEDQEFILKVAEHLLPFLEQEKPVSASDLKSTEIDAWLSGKFKKNTEAYINLFYEICIEAITKPKLRESVKTALKGRIFTIKNALVSQISPQSIQRSQGQKGITKQSEAVIKTAGRDYILSCLRTHLTYLTIKDVMTHEEQLSQTIVEMTPLLKLLTSTYLQEKGKVVPENPLRFRDPTGNNFHGLVAATFLHALLGVMGFDARLLERSDLEPKITLAVVHAIIVVTAPDGKDWIVDPTHCQFSDDLVVGGSGAITNDILVLEKSRLPEYIETEFMVHWREMRAKISSGNKGLLEAMEQGDCFLQYVYDTLKLPTHTAITSNMEWWVQECYTKVWDVDTYRGVNVNASVVEVFTEEGDGTVAKTRDLVLRMNLPALVPVTTVAHVKRQLTVMKGLLGKVPFPPEKVLPLLGSIDLVERLEFSPLLSCDPRIVGAGRINPSLNAYFHHLHSVVNPENRDFSVVYGCSGADITSPLLATNATEIMMVDFTKVDPVKLQIMLRDWSQGAAKAQALQQTLLDTGFLTSHVLLGGGQSGQSIEREQFMADIELRLAYGLIYLGVDCSTIKVTPLKKSAGVQIEFLWKHHQCDRQQKRVIKCIQADITKPASYPKVLRQQLTSGIDALYMKASFEAPFDYDKFMPQIAKSVRVGGFTMTSDKTVQGITCDPIPHLNQDGCEFALVTTAEKKLHEKGFQETFKPFTTWSVLDKERFRRNPLLDVTYWTFTTLRQKKK